MKDKEKRIWKFLIVVAIIIGVFWYVGSSNIEEGVIGANIGRIFALYILPIIVGYHIGKAIWNKLKRK